MSRLGRIPVKVSKKVELKITTESITASGAQGTSSMMLPKGIVCVQDGELLKVQIAKGAEVESTIYGLCRSLVNNLVIGVDQGYKAVLNLVGVGYRATLKGSKLELQVGFSHPLEIDIPAGIKVLVNKQVEIVITGVDKRLVYQFAALVRSKRKPEPYKGKGIRFEGEYVRKKEGKVAKAAAK